MSIKVVNADPAMGKPKSIEASIVVTRANGDVEDLGVVGYWHQDLSKHLAWLIKNRKWNEIPSAIRSHLRR